MTVKHTHKLKRHKYKSGTKIYFCSLPDCYFKIECATALGKKTICNLCNSEFIMTEYHIKLSTPHCDNCGKIKVKGDDGKKRYVRRDSLPIMASLASKTTEDLRERLSSITEPEDDI